MKYYTGEKPLPGDIIILCFEMEDPSNFRLLDSIQDGGRVYYRWSNPSRRINDELILGTYVERYRLLKRTKTKCPDCHR